MCTHREAKHLHRAPEVKHSNARAPSGQTLAMHTHHPIKFDLTSRCMRIANASRHGVCTLQMFDLTVRALQVFDMMHAH